MTTADAAVTSVGAARARLRRPAVSVNGVVLGVSLVWLTVVLVAALVPGLLTGDDPTELLPARALTPPGDPTPLGTDHYGRSVLTLLVYGARPAMIIGISAAALGALLGGVIGLGAGYVGGWVDMLVGRLMDVLMCFPGVLLALVIAAALGATTGNLVLAVGIATLPGFYRVMRGQVMTVRSRLYVEAARSAGFSSARIVSRHVLPNALAPTVVMATVTVGVSVVAAASLSFLGLGPRSDVPDWGQLLAQGQPYLATAWWVSTFPGITLTLTVIAVSLAGDWLRDRLDAD